MPVASYQGSTLVDRSQAQNFNLAVLQRFDKDIEEILYYATHVAVYDFDTKGKFWKRSNIEGTLFLLKRCSLPRCQIVVMNSKGTDNFYEDVDGSLETEVLETFLLYTKGNNQLYGIWFYEEGNCEDFGKLLNKIVRGMPKPTRAATVPGMEAASTIDDGFWDEKGRGDGRGGIDSQSTYSQLAGAAGGGGPQMGALGQGLGHGNGNGENDLMRLFRQAQERKPNAQEQQSQRASPPAVSVPGPKPLGGSDNKPTGMQSPQLAGGLMLKGSLPEPLQPAPAPVPRPLVPNSSTVPSVTIPGPLPPDFFKSTRDPGVNGTGTPPLIGNAPVQSPDPTLLPLPSIRGPETVRSLQTSFSSQSVPGMATGLHPTPSARSELMPGERDAGNDPNGLARFFQQNVRICDGATQTTNNGGGSEDLGRGKLRQALQNLMMNDDFLDLMASELRKVGVVLD